MSDPIQEALARSQALASAAVAAVPSVVNTAIAAPVPVKFTMEQMAAAGMTVDKWLKISPDGIKIGDSKLITEPIKATIDMTEGSGFILKYSIKGGNPAIYKSTIDMVNCTAGGSWEDAVEFVRRLESSAMPYRTADLPFTLTEDVKVGGVVAGAMGDVVGYSLSTTNWANWATFFKEVANAGLLGQVVPCLLTAQERTNTAKNVWGVLKIELVK